MPEIPGPVIAICGGIVYGHVLSVIAAVKFISVTASVIFGITLNAWGVFGAIVLVARS